MQYRSVKGYTGSAQIGFLMVFLGLGLVLAGIAQWIIALQVVPAGTAMKDMADASLKALKDPSNTGYARLAQVLGTLLLLCIPALLFSRVVHGKKIFWMGINRHINIQQVFFGFLIIFCANILASPLADFSKYIVQHFPSFDAYATRLENMYNEQVVVLSNLQSWPEYLLAIMVMAFFPALFEELFFRGALQNLLVRWWKLPLLAIIVTSVLFSLIHSSVYLFLSRVLLGFVLGLMYYKTRNLWVNVVAHFLNNFIALTQLFYMSRSSQKIDVKEIDPAVPLWVALIAFMAIIGFFMMLKKYSEKNRLLIDNKYQLLMVTESNDPPFVQDLNR